MEFWTIFWAVFVSLSASLAIAYVMVMSIYTLTWRKLPVWEIPADFQPSTTVTILIPARDEAENILPCLHSILAQSYPKALWEAIILDDHSTDATPALVKNLQEPNIRLLHLADFVQNGETQSFKKKAIEIGIAHAQGDLIVTTDADCLTQANWLALLVSYYEKTGSKFIAAPVNFHRERNALERFQSLDFLGMMGITGAGIHGQFMRMCNGANLAYAKSVFYEVDGFAGIDHLASGDDMLLMQKVAERYPQGIGYVKNRAATTFTTAKPTLQSFINQRLRWATKSASYREWLVTFILAVVFLFCAMIVGSVVLIPVFKLSAIKLLLGLLGVKVVMDYIFLRQMAAFFHRADLLRTFWPSFFMHIAYIVGIGLLANLVKEYDWKGRRVR